MTACASKEPPPEHEATRDALVGRVRGVALGGSIDLRELAQEEWDRVGIFGPYSSNADLKRVLEIDFDLEGASPWSNTEGGNVFVFADGDRFAMWVGIPNSVKYIGCLDGGIAIPADSAVLRLLSTESGNTALVPEKLVPCVDNALGQIGA